MRDLQRSPMILFPATHITSLLCTVGLVTLLASPRVARAELPAECADFCEDLDELDELCEDLIGDGVGFCLVLEEVEDQCDVFEGEDGDDADEDADEATGADDDEQVAGGEEEEEEDDDGEEEGTCPELCEQTLTLSTDCDDALGADHKLCQELDELVTEECASSDSASSDGARRAMPTNASARCEVGPSPVLGGLLSGLVALLVFGRRRH